MQKRPRFAALHHICDSTHFHDTPPIPERCVHRRPYALIAHRQTVSRRHTPTGCDPVRAELPFIQKHHH